MAEDPLEPRRCTARSKRSGEQCRRAPMVGQSVCAMHGGKSRGAVERAAERVAEEQAGKVLGKIWDRDAVPVVDAVAGMQQLAGRLSHAVDVLGDRVEVGELDGATALAWQRVVRELRQLLEAMERLGIAQRYVQVEGARVELIASALGRVFEVLGLDEGQRVLGGRVLMAELRASEGGAGVTGS